jgi:hypothetical protein
MYPGTSILFLLRREARSSGAVAWLSSFIFVRVYAANRGDDPMMLSGSHRTTIQNTVTKVQDEDQEHRRRPAPELHPRMGEWMEVARGRRWGSGSRRVMDSMNRPSGVSSRCITEPLFISHGDRNEMVPDELATFRAAVRVCAIPPRH